MDAELPIMFPWQREVLERALALKQEDRLPQAVLLETVSDYQMDDLARYLSMLLLCDQPQNLSLCGTCEACRMMSAGTYADFSLVTLEVDAKSKKLSKNIKIEQIRNLIHELHLTRKYSRSKIAVIFPAEAMNKSSANALLKTLEEPAAGVLLLLITRNPGRIPITLRSRCQSWAIDPVDQQTSLEWLTNQGGDAKTAAQYLQYAGGDPLLAVDLQQHNYAQRVQSFKSSLTTFLRGGQSASDLCKNLLSGEVAVSRRLIEMTLKAYCYKACGIDSSGQRTSAVEQSSAQDLLDLQRRAQQQLQVEENNLDFQLQLEDVLISLKQILTRRLN
jgi:DNA polymerase-3 subunit delta'